jgi:ADP-ribose pyrophosphatase YjhB (NUDIX family)
MARPKKEPVYRNPAPTVDLIIEVKTGRGKKGIVLIKRRNPPYGWALPGGFVDYGESLESAAVREAREETSLDVKLLRQLHTYSDPDRDPRKHTITTVFVARGRGTPEAGDDAGDIGVFAGREIDFPLAFDHRKILDDYFRSIRKVGRTRRSLESPRGGRNARPRS